MTIVYPHTMINANFRISAIPLSCKGQPFFFLFFSFLLFFSKKKKIFGCVTASEVLLVFFLNIPGHNVQRPDTGSALVR